MIFLACAVVACGNDAPPADDDPVLDGGRATVEGCGYDVVTRAGAEAPVPGGEVVGENPDPYQVRLGYGGSPADPKTSIAIVWRTDELTDVTQVRYGTGGQLDQTASGLTYRYGSGLDGIPPYIRMHEIHLCGLAPDTEYTYQVGGGEAWSTEYTFRTAPDIIANPDAEVLIGYVGDGRGGYDIWETMVGALGARAPDLLIYTGDLVTFGFDQAEWDTMFAATGDLLATVPMVAAHGNHEVNAVHYYSQLAMPEDEENFAFDFGHLHQVILNSDPIDVGVLEGATADFLDADLTEDDSRWTIVSMHRPLYTSSTRHSPDALLQAAWGPILDEHLVDLVIAGHNHCFERTQPIRAGVVGATFADGTVHITSGGAGADLYSIKAEADREPYFLIGEESYNATVISVRRDMLSAETFREDGSPLDSFVITKP